MKHCDTLHDNTVTIRYRDSMQQERVDISRLPEIMAGKVSLAWKDYFCLSCLDTILSTI
jgi:glycyl-tRNA synthetase (class II)